MQLSLSSHVNLFHLNVNFYLTYFCGILPPSGVFKRPLREGARWILVRLLCRRFASRLATQPVR
jgi:hypothetical protein